VLNVFGYPSDCYFVILYILIVVFYLNVCICVNVSVDCIYRGYTYLYIFVLVLLYSGLLETLFRSLGLYKHTEKLTLKLTFYFLDVCSIYNVLFELRNNQRFSLKQISTLDFAIAYREQEVGFRSITNKCTGFNSQTIP